MTPEEMKQRTMNYALRIIQLVQALPPGRVGDVLGGQLLRSGTSVGANYRAACRARSKAEFVSKLAIVEEEDDESLFWMELIVAAKLMTRDRVQNLLAEGNEILSIVVASITTARGRRQRTQEQSATGTAPAPQAEALREIARLLQSAMNPHSAIRNPQ